MAKLTAAKRKKIPTKDFAVPGRKYPISDKAHARNALARVSQFGDSKEKAEVRAKVKAKFPSIGQKSKGAKKPTMHRMHTDGHNAIGSHSGYHMAMKGKR